MRRGVYLAVVGCAIFVASCRAGMPAYRVADLPRVRTLADVARLRFEVISFFGLALLIFAAMIQRLWNGLRKDFARLPRLSYLRALSVVLLWGLLFLLVLTMISGARELMTPGAWEKVGVTYRLAPDAPPIEGMIHSRYEAIMGLNKALWDGRASGTRFPNREAIAISVWSVPGHPGASYVYLGGEFIPRDDDDRDEPRTPSAPQPQLLVVEPAEVGNDRLAIFRNGRVGWVGASEIDSLSKPEAPR